MHICYLYLQVLKNVGFNLYESMTENVQYDRFLHGKLDTFLAISKMNSNILFLHRS